VPEQRLPGRLALETGAVFDGMLFGALPADERVVGEVVFNTCMSGYQEVATDPSYAGQMVVMTHPLIGNYGCRDDTRESRSVWCTALIVRELSPDVSHARADRSLEDELKLFGVPGMCGVDTRALTRHLRNHGTVRGVLARAEAVSWQEQLEAARNAPTVSDIDLVAMVSQAVPVTLWEERLDPTLGRAVHLSGAAGAFSGVRIAVLDYGVKRNMMRALHSRGAEITVLRHDATVEDVLAQHPHGVVLSNGPGDPSNVPHAVRLCADLLERRVPVLGICLGHQILGRAIGATTSRLHFGHHGGNHPVRDASTGAVYVTSQNHEFQVDASSLPEGSGWYVSERNLNDGSVEGLRHVSLPAFSVQYHPEGAPGPQDRGPVFDEFLTLAAATAGHRVPTLHGVTTAMRATPMLVDGRVVAGDGDGQLSLGVELLPTTEPVSPKGLPEKGVSGTPTSGTRAAARPRCVMVIGSGPIVIGQAAEFDYAGTQACRALREEGVRVVLVNSNPATIMTDDGSADAVYVEPLTVAMAERIIEREKPDGLLATLGGQTGLNLAVELADTGVLERHGVTLLGTSLEAIRAAEDRELFKQLLISIGEPVPESATVASLAEARVFREKQGLPLVVRPAFTLGGTGGGICETDEQLTEVVAAGLSASPIGRVLVERSVVGWREIEYEVMRDASGTCITVCNMENLDPMGVHTGDSVVVAPAQTLTDREHQQLRSAALRIISALDIAGGCNVQFALEPDGHDYFVIEVNPRVSRSSALASKATGYPIARSAAKIAVGLRLDEIPNAVTGRTCAAFEPALDYCVVKVPRWPFDKFPDADRRLTTQMKSTGEVMAIERSFEAALSKALRSLEQRPPEPTTVRDSVLVDVPNDRRLWALMEALRSGVSVDEVAKRSGIGRWFVERLRTIVDGEQQLRWAGLDDEAVVKAKRMALSDGRIATLAGVAVEDVRNRREELGLSPVYKCVDTCAAEFEAATPYYYSTFEVENEGPSGAGGPMTSMGTGKRATQAASQPAVKTAFHRGTDHVAETVANAALPPGAREAPDNPVVVLGSGPIRIGQGIEFDCCSVQAAQALRASGRPAVMVNSNPETVSTDFDCSDRLYFEPLDVESALAVIHEERAGGVVVQFGGQTAINLAAPLAERGVTIMGSGVGAIDVAEDRHRFDELLRELDILRPPGAATTDPEEALAIAQRIGFPVLVRPSYVLGGRAMEVAYTRAVMERYLEAAMAALPDGAWGRRGTVLVDKYLMGTEFDVDAISDGDTIVVPGIMEHVERAGVHSGDSMAVYPATAPPHVIDKIVENTVRLARAMNLRGLLNVQYVVYRGQVHVIEVNPRSSRTVPFLSKVTGVPMVELAVRVLLGERLSDLGYDAGLVPSRPLVAVKAPVFSMVKLIGVDTALGPEMKSTGEVMGIDVEVGAALEKAFQAALGTVPGEGGALCTIADADKAEALPTLAALSEAGFTLYATEGTAAALRAAGLSAVAVGKIGGNRPNVLDVIEDGRVSLVVNTLSNVESDELRHARNGDLDPGRSVKDGYLIRLAAARKRVACCTSLDTAAALVDAMARQRAGESVALATVADYRVGAVGSLASR
jgi:carbamoyl-phosphate synthase large subunit